MRSVFTTSTKRVGCIQSKIIASTVGVKTFSMVLVLPLLTQYLFRNHIHRQRTVRNNSTHKSQKLNINLVVASHHSYLVGNCFSVLVSVRSHFLRATLVVKCVSHMQLKGQGFNLVNRTYYVERALKVKAILATHMTSKNCPAVYRETST